MSLFYLVSAYPLWRLYRANIHTSLRVAVYWTFAAWVAWGLSFFWPLILAAPESAEELRYVSLCLTGCAGVAVLGARRPHAAAWNFVVIGLLAVLLLPVIEHRLLGTPWRTDFRLVFLGGILLLSVLNYFPTRMGGAALFVGLGCLMEWLELLQPPSVHNSQPNLNPLKMTFFLAVASWIGFLCWRRQTSFAFDALWMDFRDRYGLVWGRRVQEQFNHSVRNAGLPIRLTWGGLEPRQARESEQLSAAALETLRALLKRFMPAA